MKRHPDDDRPTEVFPRVGRPHGAPWQGPPPKRDRPPPHFDRSMVAVIAILAAAMVIICGIAAWFLGEVIPG